MGIIFSIFAKWSIMTTSTTTTSTTTIYNDVNDSIQLFHSVQSMQERTANWLAASLWREQDALEKITGYFTSKRTTLSIYTENNALDLEEWYQVERYVQVKAMFRKLPNGHKLYQAVAMLGMQIREWLESLALFAEYHDCEVESKVNEFSWIMVRELNKRSLAELFSEVSNNAEQEISENTPFIFNYLPLEHLWDTLNAADKEILIDTLCENYIVYPEDAFFFLLKQLNEKQLRKFIENNAQALLNYLVFSTRQWQIYFKPSITHLFNKLSKSARFDFMWRLIGIIPVTGLYYKKIFLYLWEGCSVSFKVGMLLGKRDLILNQLFSFKDLHIFQEVVKDASERMKSEIIVSVSDSIICMVFDDGETLLDIFLKDVFKSDESVLEIKKKVAYQGWIFYNDMLFKEEFERFLNWCLPTKKLVKEFCNSMIKEDNLIVVNGN